MKEENEITEEVRQLLDSLEQHGHNVRRQKELSDLIDHLERKTENGTPKGSPTEWEVKLSVFHFPLSVIAGGSLVPRPPSCYFGCWPDPL